MKGNIYFLDQVEAESFRKLPNDGLYSRKRRNEYETVRHSSSAGTNRAYLNNSDVIVPHVMSYVVSEKGNCSPCGIFLAPERKRIEAVSALRSVNKVGSTVD